MVGENGVEWREPLTPRTKRNRRLPTVTHRLSSDTLLILSWKPSSVASGDGTMATRTISGFEVDTDDFAQRLERIAEGIRSGDVMLTEMESGHGVGMDDPSKFELGFSYVATPEYTDVPDPINYDYDDAEDEQEDASRHAVDTDDPNNE